MTLVTWCSHHRHVSELLCYIVIHTVWHTGKVILLRNSIFKGKKIFRISIIRKFSTVPPPSLLEIENQQAVSPMSPIKKTFLTLLMVSFPICHQITTIVLTIKLKIITVFVLEVWEGVSVNRLCIFRVLGLTSDQPKVTSPRCTLLTPDPHSLSKS